MSNNLDALVHSTAASWGVPDAWEAIADAGNIGIDVRPAENGNGGFDVCDVNAQKLRENVPAESLVPTLKEFIRVSDAAWGKSYYGDKYA